MKTDGAGRADAADDAGTVCNCYFDGEEMMDEYWKELVRDLRTYVPDEGVCNAAADLIEEMVEERERCEEALIEMRGAIAELESAVFALLGENA